MSMVSKPRQGLGYAVETDETAFAGLIAPKPRGPAGLNRRAIIAGFAAALFVTAFTPQISQVMAENSGGAMEFLLQQAKVNQHRASSGGFAPAPAPASLAAAYRELEPCRL